MAAPPKLWERQRQHINQRQPIFNPDSNNSFMQSSPFLPPGSGGGGGLSPALAPPLPPRPPSTSLNTYGRPTYGSFSSYGGGGGYGNYGVGTYGGGYGNYGRYGMIGQPSNMPMDENGFIQLAEESSRPAFESIESIVHAFGSVSMMLESTYHAVHSSFRAVLGVAEHFGRMKSHFAQIFSALAVVRTLRWVYKKLLYLIGLRLQDPNLETAWQNSSSLPSVNQITEADIKASKSSWPIVMFLAVVFSGPYLIWRLLSSLVPARNVSKAWMQGRGEHFPAQALHNFKAGGQYELSLNAGQQLFLAPHDQQPSVRGWLLASNGRACGLVPANYIKIFRTGLATIPSPSPGSSPIMHPQGLNQGPGQARRMPAPTNPHMTGQMPNIMPSPQYRPPNQLPHNSMPYPAQHPSHPRLPHIQPPNSRQASIPHSSSYPLPPHSQLHPVSQYQSNPYPPHTQTHPQQPGHPSLMNGSQNTRSNQSLPQLQSGQASQNNSQSDMKHSQSDSHPEQHLVQDTDLSRLTKKPGHVAQEPGREMQEPGSINSTTVGGDPRGAREKGDPGTPPSITWDDFGQSKSRGVDDEVMRDFESSEDESEDEEDNDTSL